MHICPSTRWSVWKCCAAPSGCSNNSNGRSSCEGRSYACNVLIGLCPILRAKRPHSPCMSARCVRPPCRDVFHHPHPSRRVGMSKHLWPLFLLSILFPNGQSVPQGESSTSFASVGSAPLSHGPTVRRRVSCNLLPCRMLHAVLFFRFAIFHIRPTSHCR